MFYLILALVLAAFVAGILVGRKNRKKVEQAVALGKAAANTAEAIGKKVSGR